MYLEAYNRKIFGGMSPKNQQGYILFVVFFENRKKRRGKGILIWSFIKVEVLYKNFKGGVFNRSLN